MPSSQLQCLRFDSAVFELSDLPNPHEETLVFPCRLLCLVSCISSAGLPVRPLGYALLYPTAAAAMTAPSRARQRHPSSLQASLPPYGDAQRYDVGRQGGDHMADAFFRSNQAATPCQSADHQKILISPLSLYWAHNFSWSRTPQSREYNRHKEWLWYSK